MSDQGDRVERAASYVLGEMKVEVDALREAAAATTRREAGAARRAAVPARRPDRDWAQIRTLLAELPQMRHSEEQAQEPAAKFGKRRPDRPTINVPQTAPTAWRFRFGRLALSLPALPAAPKVVSTGLRSVSWRHAMLVAGCLIATFALGFLTGKM